MEKQVVFEKCKHWFKENLLILLYFIFAVLIEMAAVFAVEGSPFISRPFLAIGLLILICGIAFLIKNNTARLIFCSVMLILQGVLDLVFAVIFDMTDQYFDLGMLSLRNDAFAILENIPMNFIAFYAALFFCIMFIVYGLRTAHAKKRVTQAKHSVFFYVGLILAGIATMGISFITYYPRSASDKYDGMIEGKQTSTYSSYGMMGNLFGEFGKRIFQDRTPMDESELDRFIYQSVAPESEYFGVAKDKNVVVILAESLEWYTFLRGDTEYARSLQGEYPNALDIPQEDLNVLYPNLTEYYNESVVMTNFHGREKTDLAECISIMGSYPTGSNVYQDYTDNTIPYTLPNILKAETGGDIYLRSFHNGFKTFYKRNVAHPALGFEGLTDMYDMEEISNRIEEAGGEEVFYNYMDDGERNLDSQMIDAAKDYMFPTDGRFYTYITTITMHGMYYNRQNLSKENNEKLRAQIELLEQYKPEDENALDYKNRESLYYYMTTGLEFDYMLGRLKDELRSRKDAQTGESLLDNTTIVLFADHNAYYQEMSNYVKGIKDYDSESKFTDLYNVPFMIWDADLIEKIPEESRVIDKFTCTADIVPTILDLLGIRYYENLYYGHSVFSSAQSVLYSRAYDYFISDGVLRWSVQGDFYQYDGMTEDGVAVADTLSAFEREATQLVQKIKYCDYIFKQDHFGTEKNYQRFKDMMKEINA